MQRTDFFHSESRERVWLLRRVCCLSSSCCCPIATRVPRISHCERCSVSNSSSSSLWDPRFHSSSENDLVTAGGSRMLDYSGFVVSRPGEKRIPPHLPRRLSYLGSVSRLIHDRRVPRRGCKGLRTKVSDRLKPLASLIRNHRRISIDDGPRVNSEAITRVQILVYYIRT